MCQHCPMAVTMTIFQAHKASATGPYTTFMLTDPFAYI